MDQTCYKIMSQEQMQSWFICNVGPFLEQCRTSQRFPAPVLGQAWGCLLERLAKPLGYCGLGRVLLVKAAVFPFLDRATIPSCALLS